MSTTEPPPLLTLSRPLDSLTAERLEQVGVVQAQQADKAHHQHVPADAETLAWNRARETEWLAAPAALEALLRALHRRCSTISHHRSPSASTLHSSPCWRANSMRRWSHAFWPTGPAVERISRPWRAVTSGATWTAVRPTHRPTLPAHSQRYCSAGVGVRHERPVAPDARQQAGAQPPYG